MFNLPEEIVENNPFSIVPVLVERDLVLYESNIINEYIDERFPYPQLMPSDPAERARARLFLYRFEKELFSQIDAIEHSEQKVANKARQSVRDYLNQISSILSKQKYILGDEFSMLDVAIAPLLWRLNHYGIQLGKEAAPLMEYAERIFSRPAYLNSMTPTERAMRKAA
jgi:RNA polymerase-associated protein